MLKRLIFAFARRGAVLLLIAAFAAPAAGQTSFRLRPTRDTTLYFDDAGAISNGSGPGLFVGRTANTQPEPIRRGLLHFDVASAVPAGSRIVDVRLEVFVSRSSSEAVPVTVHRTLADWGEAGSDAGLPGGDGAPAEPGDATWSHRFWPSALWSRPGGDYVASESAVELLSGVGDYAFTGAGLIADVQYFLDHPEENFGWTIVGFERRAQTAKRLESRESAIVDQRPRLIIVANGGVLPDPPMTVPMLGHGALVLFTMGLLGFGWRRLRQTDELR